jgi:5-methylcytosine-specific restriction endonuclease McrA
MTYKSHGRAGHRWRRLRKQVLDANDICWLCGKPGADTVDHVLPLSIYPELAHDIGNLRPAHQRCNSAKGAGAPGAHQAPMLRSRRW